MISKGNHAFHYRVFGLTLESTFSCPELVPASEGKPDVHVSRGSVPDRLKNVSSAGRKYQANTDEVLIKTKSIADILVSYGTQIVVEPKVDAQDEQVRALFLGWGMGALLHQRGMLPLHGSVISLGDECIVFCAPSGAGKSSLAALFVKRGYRLLDDNIAAVGLVDRVPKVYPGYAVIKLPSDVQRKREYSFLSPGPFLPALGKYTFQVRQDSPAYPQTLRKIYVLEHGEHKTCELTPLSGGAKFRFLMQNVFCAQFLRGTDKLPLQFRAVESIAARTPAMQAWLPDWPTPYDDVADLLEYDFSRSSS